MNKHILIDNLTAYLAGLIAGKRKFFANSVTGRSFQKLIEATEITVPEIRTEGTFEIESEILTRHFDAAFKVEKWTGSDYPTIIYHHGNNERPFNYGKGAKNTFLNIFVKHRKEFNANLIVVRAPFHNCALKIYQQKMCDLENFMSMISVSVKLNEAIINIIRKSSKGKIITCGISLGGWVTNLHRSIFNSATSYIPLLAGTYLGEVFLQSKYKRLTGLEALQQPGLIRECLNFNVDFDIVTDPNVFPLLAEYDQFIEYDIQRESYKEHPIKTIKAGHVTGALMSKELKAHILGKL